GAIRRPSTAKKPARGRNSTRSSGRSANSPLPHGGPGPPGAHTQCAAVSTVRQPTSVAVHAPVRVNSFPTSAQSAGSPFAISGRTGGAGSCAAAPPPRASAAASASARPAARHTRRARRRLAPGAGYPPTPELMRPEARHSRPVPQARPSAALLLPAGSSPHFPLARSVPAERRMAMACVRPLVGGLRSALTAAACAATLGIVPGTARADLEAAFAARADGDALRALWLEGRALERADDLAAAAERFTRLAEALPDEAEPRWRLARVEWRRGERLAPERSEQRLAHFRRAEQEARRSLDLDLRCAEGMFWLAAALGRLTTTEGVI